MSGILLGLAGILLIFINVVFTPKFLAIEPYSEGVASSVYAWRLGLASFIVMISIIASVGIYSYYIEKYPNSMRSIMLLLSLLIGNSMLLAHEWNQFLFVRELAISFPDTLNQLNELDGLSLYDLSAILAASLYFLGWLVGVIILWTSQVIKLRVALLIILGLVASPLLANFIPVVYAGIISSLLLGAGWFLLGRRLYQSPSFTGSSE
jgi:hypothetical protein